MSVTDDYRYADFIFGEHFLSRQCSIFSGNRHQSNAVAGIIFSLEVSAVFQLFKVVFHQHSAFCCSLQHCTLCRALSAHVN